MENKTRPNTPATSNAGISMEQTLNGKELYRLENMIGSPETKKITNLNTDCMEIIFKHLDLNDLLNVVDSSREFYSAACMVYKKQYGNAYMIYDIESGR